MKSLFILYESLFLMSFPSVFEPPVQLNEIGAIDSTKKHSEDTLIAAKSQIWDITLLTGQIVANIRPVAVRDQSLIVMRGDKTYTFQIWNIIRLKVPGNRLSEIRNGMKKGFIIPFKIAKGIPFDYEPESLGESLGFLLLLPFILLIGLIFVSFIGIIGALIGGTIGAFRQSERDIDLYEMRVSEKVKLIKNLIAD